MSRTLAIAAALAALTGIADAHDEAEWILRENLRNRAGEHCCGPRDCAPVASGGVREVAGGYLVTETGEVIAHGDVLWRSPEGRWWRCRYVHGPRAGMTRCLIGHPPGS